MKTKENIRILLTDDDEDERDFFGQAIKDLDFKYPLEFCKNGVELLDHLHEKSSNIPDIIFLDLNMAILSGFETLQKIRTNDLFKNIPVIAIYSTSSTMTGINAAFGSGANAYIVKPVSFKDLKKIIIKVIETNWEEKSVDTKIESFIITI